MRYLYPPWKWIEMAEVWGWQLAKDYVATWKPEGITHARQVLTLMRAKK